MFFYPLFHGLKSGLKKELHHYLLLPGDVSKSILPNSTVKLAGCLKQFKLKKQGIEMNLKFLISFQFGTTHRIAKH
jgi:hypothetical protein